MRIDVLSGISRNEGGLFYSVRWLSQALLRAGVDVRLVSHVDNHTREDLPLWGPVPVELHPGSGPLLYSRKLRSLLNSTSADLLHVQGIWLDRQWAALQWQERTGRPVVISPRGMLDPWAVRNSAWKKKLVGALFANRSLRQASCIHALCLSEAESVWAYGLKAPVAVIPNGVEIPEIDGMLNPAPASRKRLLFLGRIHPKKGLSELISAWARLRRDASSVADWQLIVAGWDDGGHLLGLRDQCGDHGLLITDSLDENADVCFPGPVFGDEKDWLLRSVNAFVLPSFSEGLPMSVLEAWSYGLPVVMTDACNIPAGFKVDAALRVEPSVDSIKQGLDDLLHMSDAQRQAMGMNGRLLVEREFAWNRIAADMKAVYAWCLGGDKPACILER